MSSDLETQSETPSETNPEVSAVEFSTPDTSKPNAQSASPFNILISLWVTPTSAYQQLKPKTKLWFPFLAVILAQLAVHIYYSMNVGFAWMLEQTLNASGRDFSPEQREAMERMQGGMGGTLSAVAGSVGIVIMFSLVFSLVAGYFTLVSSFTADNIRFKQWFGFVCWSATPMMLAALASAITMALNNNGQIMQSDLNPLTLNSLLFKFNFGESGYTFLSSLDLTAIWGLVLYVVGYKTWTGKPMGQYVLIAAMPFCVITGIAALFIFT